MKKLIRFFTIAGLILFLAGAALSVTAAGMGGRYPNFPVTVKRVWHNRSQFHDIEEDFDSFKHHISDIL